MSALQPAVRVAATPRLATNSGSAMDKRLLKRTVLFLIPIGYTVVAFFGISSIGNVVVGHDVRVGRVLGMQATSCGGLCLPRITNLGRDFGYVPSCTLPCGMKE